MKRLRIWTLALTLTLTLATWAQAEAPQKSRGQLIHVSAYSHIYHGKKNRPFPLAVTLAVRNVDPATAIRVTSIKYFDSEGKLLKELAEQPATLGPLASLRKLVDEDDMSGGSGASFLVSWEADDAAAPPSVQTVMIGTASTQGISFLSEGRVVREK